MEQNSVKDAESLSESNSAPSVQFYGLLGVYRVHKISLSEDETSPNPNALFKIYFHTRTLISIIRSPKWCFPFRVSDWNVVGSTHLSSPALPVSFSLAWSNFSYTFCSRVRQPCYKLRNSQYVFFSIILLLLPVDLSQTQNIVIRVLFSHSVCFSFNAADICSPSWWTFNSNQRSDVVDKVCFHSYS